MPAAVTLFLILTKLEARSKQNKVRGRNLDMFWGLTSSPNEEFFAVAQIQAATEQLHILLPLRRQKPPLSTCEGTHNQGLTDHCDDILRINHLIICKAACKSQQTLPVRKPLKNLQQAPLLPSRLIRFQTPQSPAAQHGHIVRNTPTMRKFFP
jgi:hypothetical protein